MLNRNKTINDNIKLVSVCVATYKRLDSLKQLLNSLNEQILPAHTRLEIIITDNDSEASAQAVVKNFSASYCVDIKYFLQPIKNISVTRNVSLRNASGAYIAFVDDDETADKYWIFNLLNSLNKFNADGVFGNVIPIFDNKISEKFKKREFYFSPLTETGEIARYYYTTNALIKTSIIREKNIVFDPSYGLTGGEDVHFFERLSKEGAKFIVCKDAITYEYIPPERASLKYLFNRSLRGGQSFTRRKLELNNNKTLKISITLKSLMKIIIGLIYTLFSIFCFKISTQGMILLGDSIGKFRGIIGKYKNLY